jgi:hypothetical protein
VMRGEKRKRHERWVAVGRGTGMMGKGSSKRNAQAVGAAGRPARQQKSLRIVGSAFVSQKQERKKGEQRQGRNGNPLVVENKIKG